MQRCVGIYAVVKVYLRGYSEVFGSYGYLIRWNIEKLTDGGWLELTRHANKGHIRAALERLNRSRDSARMG